MTKVSMKLEFCDCELRKIDEIRERLELNNNAEVVAYGIAILMKIIEHLDKGDKVKFKSNKWKYPSENTATWKI